MNKQINKKLQRRYDNLSLVDRNAYEQIIERNKSHSNWLNYPFSILKLITYTGLFFIVFSIMSGVGIETFRLSYLSLCRAFVLICIPFMLIGIISDLFGLIKINKLKRKLLNN